MSLMPKDPNIERLSERATDLILEAQDIARQTLGEDASKNDATVMQIAMLMGMREAAEMIGFELSVTASKKR
jgi:hypothetical protein